MDLDILEENEREIKVSLIGQDHTIANLMKSIFLQDNRVEIASYNIDHPTLSDPILHVKVNEGEDLRETMNEILDQTIEEFRDLEEQFSETA
ncbi:DNA-directed RNA polymerase subunit L [Methanonatronarchaeum sp. AMET6-2]|uniref:DNA-directed RNA polymerase subunit L n=1 Tax=Methanonatronarchaeum sp. AMET6-2 TaxID=2933293 RepID=UPI001FF228D1|nr:DNA-directed RNA polymerase subunit L [Methanonatronarchaeum sp. AMET6-2]UOY10205.1 DNA-directed RNA polymerase subunit L [Methanonatronarchaeum sp. AMET6-2]